MPNRIGRISCCQIRLKNPKQSLTEIAFSPKKAETVRLEKIFKFANKAPFVYHASAFV